MKNNISFDEAVSIIVENTFTLSTEKVFLNDAVGRVIAEEIYSNIDIPPFNNSAMDGFAIKSEDTLNASKNSPVKLKIIADAPAGKVVDVVVGKGETVKIMTGGKIPEGADAVLRREDVKEKDGYIYIFSNVKKMQDIRFKGEDIKKGELTISHGKVLTPARIGILASLGRAFVEVYRRPLVSILVTGDEIVDIDMPLPKGKIRNSNGYTLMSLLKEYNIPYNQNKIVSDSKQALIDAIRSNTHSDIILSTGGVSMGDYDFVKDVVKDLGFEPLFWKVRVKPGRPLFFAKSNRTLYFGIPGNPVSTMTTFYNFILPALRKMQNFENISLREINATLTGDIKRKSNRVEFIRGFLYSEKNKFFVKPTGPQGSGILSSMHLGNCFIVVDENIKKVEKGDNIKIRIFDKEFFYE